MVLEILGNVFGKSKKNSNQQQTNGQTEDSTPNDNESYVFVNHNNSTPYPQTTILTDEMIRMGSSSSVMHQPHQPHVSQTTATASGQASLVYPSLDVTNGYNPNMPFSSAAPASSRNSLAAPFSSTNLTRNASPIDNVPFALTANYGGSSSGSGGIDDDSDVNETLARIHQFMANPNLSEYNFKLENSILQESLLT